MVHISTATSVRRSIWMAEPFKSLRPACEGPLPYYNFRWPLSFLLLP